MGVITGGGGPPPPPAPSPTGIHHGETVRGIVTGEGSVNWSAKYIGAGYYLLYPSTNNGYVEAKGSSTTIKFSVLVPHIIQRIEIQHTDNADAASTASMALALKRTAAKPEPPIARPIFDLTAWTKTDTMMDGEDFPHDTYIFPAGGYHLIHNTTNTHRIYFNLIVQVV